MPSPGQITRLLQEAERGDTDAANRLFVLVQDDLKAIARRRKRAVAGKSDVSTTMLVDDAFCRLVSREMTTWQPGDRRKFFGYMAARMHDLLIDAVRARNAVKRGGGRKCLEDDQSVLAGASAPADQGDALLDLRQALGRFEKFALDDAIVFRIRNFLGCTFREAADIVNVSVTEAKRAFERARLWLQRELKEYALET